MICFLAERYFERKWASIRQRVSCVEVCEKFQLWQNCRSFNDLLHEMLLSSNPTADKVNK